MASGYDSIFMINSMAKCPAQYRHNWKAAAEKQAEIVRAEIARLRKFASLKAGKVATLCCSTADDLEAKMTEAMAQF